MFKLYKTYNTAKNVFVKPKLVLKIGFWRNMEGLPFSRHGNIIRLTKYGYYYPNNCVTVKSNDSRFRSYFHKLPKGCENGVWFRNIRKNLRKFRLGWLKPVYELPLYLSFYIFDFDVCYKLKYDEFRYEFPPQFTIVFFGISLSFWLNAPEETYNPIWSNCSYWESMLWYLNECDLDENYKRVNKNWFK